MSISPGERERRRLSRGGSPRKARAAGVGHLLYTSIIGRDQVPWSYFRVKVRTEEVVDRKDCGFLHHNF